MVLNKDFKEFIKLLNAHNVRYLVVGGYAVALHGYPRYTKDLDIWILVDPANAINMANALRDFGFTGLNPSDFLIPDEFVQLGYPPNRIDIITSCEGLDFETAYARKEKVGVDDLEVHFLDLDSLLVNKRAVGRPQDKADVSNLQKKRPKK